MATDLTNNALDMQRVITQLERRSEHYREITRAEDPNIDHSATLTPEAATGKLVWSPGCRIPSTVTVSNSKDSSVTPVVVAALAVIASWALLPTIFAIATTAIGIFLATRGESSSSEPRTISTPCEVSLSGESLSCERMKLSDEEYELFAALFEKSGSGFTPLCPLSRSFMLIPARIGNGAYHEYTALSEQVVRGGQETREVQLLQQGDTSLSDEVKNVILHLARAFGDYRDDSLHTQASVPIPQLTERVRRGHLQPNEAFQIAKLFISKVWQQQEEVDALGKRFQLAKASNASSDSRAYTADHALCSATAMGLVGRFKLSPLFNREVCISPEREQVAASQILEHIKQTVTTSFGDLAPEELTSIEQLLYKLEMDEFRKNKAIWDQHVMERRAD